MKVRKEIVKPFDDFHDSRRPKSRWSSSAMVEQGQKNCNRICIKTATEPDSNCNGTQRWHWSKRHLTPDIKCPATVAVVQGKSVWWPMFFNNFLGEKRVTGSLGKRVDHHHGGGGRLVEEVQRLEEEGDQVLLRGGWKNPYAFVLNSNVRWFLSLYVTICVILDPILETLGPALVKLFQPTHGIERRTRRRGKRAGGTFISTHIIPLIKTAISSESSKSVLTLWVTFAKPQSQSPPMFPKLLWLHLASIHILVILVIYQSYTTLVNQPLVFFGLQVHLVSSSRQ